MTPDTFVKARLAEFAYREASPTGSLDAMLAICFVIRNRVYAGWAGGDWNKIINFAFQSCAFGVIPPYDVDLSNDVFRRLLLQIDEIYNGSSQDTMTEEALYYFDSARNRPPREWFARNIVQKPADHPRVAQVGMIHLFR